MPSVMVRNIPERDPPELQRLQSETWAGSLEEVPREL
jgi:hypothetical protein